ncbi:type II toxin-antitoxin system VapC family toxin [Polaromonas sp.]|uniref:type II toxin-antitoxin system VapC family toxin n=1 Tax=Polaromonas sp. TaxID=1869339 RepID=UPI002FCA48CA
MIADSSAWIELLRATGSLVDLRLQQAIRASETLLMPEVVYREVLQGAPNPQHFMLLQARLDAVPLFKPDDARDLARHAAMLYARCRWQGITIRSPNDCLIAACAIEAGEPLLHADRDFIALATIDKRLQLL